MKRIPVFFCLFLISLAVSAQSLDGAWKVVTINGKEVPEHESVMIYNDGYFVFATKETSTHHFVGTGGGLYSIDKEGNYTETFDFNTYDAEKVGTTVSCKIVFKGESELSMTFLIDDKPTTEVWKKLATAPDDLTGTWVITGRKRGEELIPMTPGDRRTVKILAGGRFQWIAFNSKTKEFSGTGGGTYTAKDGKYTEHIEFFSRDDKRVGASLSFDYAVKDKQWHHSGLSSQGQPIYEVWSNYRKAYLEKE